MKIFSIKIYLKTPVLTLKRLIVLLKLPISHTDNDTLQKNSFTKTCRELRIEGQMRYRQKRALRPILFLEKKREKKY